MDKKDIRSLILKLVSEESASLEKVKQDVISLTGQTFLPFLLENYVEYKFVKYCLLHVENELSQLVHNLKSPEEIRSLANDTFSARQLDSLPETIGKSCVHYRLIIEEERLLTNAADRENILQKVQHAVACAVNSVTVSLATQTGKTEKFVQLLKESLTGVKSAFLSSSGYPLYSNVENQKLWHEYWKKYPDFAKKYEKIQDENERRGEEFKKEFVNSASSAVYDITFQPTVTQLGEYFLQPLTLDCKKEKGKQLLIARKPVILLSECLGRIESDLRNKSEIEEVHVIGAEVIYINCNLENSTWHGKNIVIVSKRIECTCPGLVWDLSGANGASATSTRAADGGSSEDGCDGGNGSPGESGGYGMLIADIFSSINLLTFKTNGGNGGSGQSGGHGGNGRGGKDGAEMSLSTLKSDFDSPAKASAANASATRIKTIRNLTRIVTKREKLWSTKINVDTGRLYSGFQIYDYYIRGFTDEGLHIEFASYAYIGRHSYCLVTGQSGESGHPGGFGGDGGSGGEAGFPGQLTAYHLNGSNYNWESSSPVYEAKQGESGENGEDGRDGSRGKCGRHGRDVGYVDQMYWTQGVYYEPGTYKLKVYGKEPDNSAWCPYRKKWMRIEKSTRSPPAQKESSRRNKERKAKEKVASQRKNAVNKGQMLELYGKEVTHSTATAEMGNMEFEKNLKNALNSTQQYLGKSNKKGNRRKMRKIRISKPRPAKQSRYNKRLKKKGFLQNFAENIKSKLGFKDESNEDDETDLTTTRLETLSAIRANVENTWKHSTKIRTVYVKHPTSSKSSNSALHALFGDVNSLGYFECSVSKRGECCKMLREHVPFTGKCIEFLQESLQAYFKDSSGSRDKTGEDISYKTLDKYAEEFSTKSEDFQWEKVLQDKKCVEEYITFIQQPSVPFLISDLRLVAEVYGKPLKMFLTTEGSPKCAPLDMQIEDWKEDENEVPNDDEDEDEDLIRIAVNEHHEFSRMVPVVERDMRGVWKQMEAIVDEVYSKKSKKELQDYFAEGRYGILQKADQEHEEENNSTKVEMVQEISSTFNNPDEKLVVETALLTWPTLMVSLYNDRLHEELAKRTAGDVFEYFQLAFTKITEFILNEVSSDEMAPLLWTIATEPVSNWTKRVCLICLEMYFEGVQNHDIKDWDELLEILPPKLIGFVMKLVETETEFGHKEKGDFTKFLTSLQTFKLDPQMDFQKLTGISKSLWPYQLRILFISWRLTCLPNVEWDEASNKQSQALYYLHALYNEKPSESLELLDNLQRILQKRLWKCKNITQILGYFYGGRWDLDWKTMNSLRNAKTVDEWMKSVQNSRKNFETGRQTRTISEIHEIIKNDSNSTFTPEQLEELIRLTELFEKFKIATEAQNFASEMKDWLTSTKKKINASKLDRESLPLQMECVLMIDSVIKYKLGYHLRPTQKLAIVSSLWSISTGRNLLSQICTGEGKTLVVLSVAIVLALFDKKVDVVTSSGVLAERDATSNRELFSIFGLTVGEVASKVTPEERQQEYLCDVVYGEASHFQRDHLLDRFYNQNIRGARSFENVIVDEVDSMFLDKGNSVLYLSHQPPDLDTLEAIFVFIWTQVVRTINSGEFHPAMIHEMVLSSIYPSISSEDLLQFLKDTEVSDLWNWMIRNKIINENGRLLISKVNIDNIPVHFQERKEQLEYMLQSKLEAPGQIPVMNHLKPFVEHHLFSWINSAFQATQLTEGKEYVVDVERSKTVLDKNPKIMILDIDTGVDLKESQWNEGLHQFLQLKHGCRLSPMSLKAVFISNISFFNKYRSIFGLTGTIGTESDRHFLKETYKVEILCMPLALPKQFIEEEPIIFQEDTSWKQGIYDEALDKVKTGRSVLIVCGTVQEAEVLQQHLSLKMKAGESYNIELYRRDYEQFRATEEGKSLESGEIIIATNLAGRGTDIKLSKILRENGGLHVMLSYLPDNLRVEQQAFGRAARSGDPGSGRLIFVDRISTGNNASPDAINLKIQRDEMEMTRVTDIQTYYKTVILREEDMFKQFQQSFEKLTSSLEKAYKYVRDHIDKESAEKEEEHKLETFLGGNVNEIKELVMYSMLDDWAFWLDKYSTVLVSKQESNSSDKMEMAEKGIHKFETDERKLMQSFMEMTGKYEDVSGLYQDPGLFKSMFSYSKSFRVAGWVGLKNEADAKIESYVLKLIHEPALLIKVAKCFLQRQDYEKALHYINKVLLENEGPSTFETILIPSYYKILLKLKLKQEHSSEFWELIEKVCQQLDNAIIRQSSYAGTISEIQFIGSHKVVQADVYRRQKENVVRILGIFKQSIENLTGNGRMLPQDFTSICNEQVGQHLVDHLVQQKVLLPASVKEVKDEEKKLKSLADQFGLETRRMKQILEDLSRQVLTPEVEKSLKNKLDLPSRAGFWKEIEECLENIQTFAVVQPNSQFKPDTEQKLKTCENNEFQDKWLIPGKPYISKYGSDVAKNSQMQFILKCEKGDFQKQQKYIHLRNTGQLCYEQVAFINIPKLEKLQLTKYHKIEKDSFTPITHITSEQSSKIFAILQKHGIVDNDGILQSTEWTKKKLDLTLEYEVYRGDILAILHNKCRYKYELLSILHQNQELLLPGQVESDPNLYELRMHLPSRPCKDFILTAIESGFISGLSPSHNYFDGEQSLYRVIQEPISWIKWMGNKAGDALGFNTPYLSKKDLQTIFPFESQSDLNELYDNLKATSWIKSSGEIILGKKEGEKTVTELENLSTKFEYHQQYILSLCQWRQELSTEKFIPDAISICRESQGKLRTLSNPDPNLVDIESRFEGSPDKAEYSEEFQSLTLSGFDHLFDTVEETYTFGMIRSAGLVVFMGLCQIAAGIYLEYITVGAGTFLASGLIQEGIGDVIYGLMAFRSGHFSWGDWIDNKWRSVAITAVTLGLGALLAKGVRYSKFGTKLLGASGAEVSGRVVQETLVQGTAKSGIQRSIFPVLLKSFGYKVLRGVAIAGGAMAVSYAYDKALKKFVDHFSEQIFSNSDEAIQNHSISGELASLVDKVGVVKAQEIVDRCSTRVLKSSSCETDAKVYLSTILSPVLGGLSHAFGKMNRAGAFTSGDSTLLILLLRLSSGLMTVAGVVDALKNMKESINKHLNELQREIKKEVVGLSVTEQVAHNSSTKEEKDAFIYQFKQRTNQLMRDKIGAVMQYTIIEPLMHLGCQKLLTTVGRKIRGVYREYREAGILTEIKNVKFELNSLSADAPEEEKKRLHHQIVQLCSKSRDPQVIAHATEFGGPLGVESVQALANQLGVRIVVDSDNPNVPKVFEPQNGGGGGEGGEVATLHLKHTMASGDPNDLGHWEPTSGEGGGGGVQSGFSPDCLLDAVNAELKVNCPGAASVSRAGLANFMRVDPTFGEFVRNGWHHSFNAIGGFGGARMLKEDLQKTGKQKTRIIKELELYQNVLRDTDLMVDLTEQNENGDAKHRPGPIKEYYMVTVDGKDVLFFQSGEVTPETAANRQTRSNAAAKNEVMADNLPGDQAGHVSPWAWGSPTTAYNLFPQEPEINNGVNKAIENSVTKFVTHEKIKAKNPSVEYIRCLDRAPNANGSNPRRPTSHIFYLKFKLDGRVVGTKVYEVPNPPASLERRGLRGPG